MGELRYKPNSAGLPWSMLLTAYPVGKVLGPKVITLGRAFKDTFQIQWKNLDARNPSVCKFYGHSYRVSQMLGPSFSRVYVLDLMKFGKKN
jgi:hypothetical protein